MIVLLRSARKTLGKSLTLKELNLPLGSVQGLLQWLDPEDRREQSIVVFHEMYRTYRDSIMDALSWDFISFNEEVPE